MFRADWIVITTGSSAGFIFAYLAAFNPGDRVAFAVPGYPPSRHILTALGCEPVLIETGADTRYALTGEALLAAHRKSPLKGVLVASPANPTGTMMTPEALSDLVSTAEDAGIRVISDEIYHGLDYAFPAETALRFSRDVIVANSFSKYFCMTGWRVGWLVAAGGTGSSGRSAAAKSRDLGSDAVADCGAGRVRWPRGDGRGQARL